MSIRTIRHPSTSHGLTAPRLLGLAVAVLGGTSCSTITPDLGDAGAVLDLDASGDTDVEGSDDAASDGNSDTHPAETTLVRVHYDTGLGNELTLRGQGGALSWAAGTPCTWTTGNVWECGPFELAATATVKPLVNDTDWALSDNYLVEPGTTADLYPSFYSDSGRLQTVYFASDVLDDTRGISVYLPPSYDENELKHYPVLFMQDGQNLFDPSLSAFGVSWEIDEAVDVLGTAYGIQEFIVVAPYNSGDRLYEYTPSYDAAYGDGGGADLYLDFLLDEVAPWVDATYRTDGSRPGIAGSSLGGLLSLHACWTRPADFSRCGVFSPSLWWDDSALLTAIEDSTAPKTDVRYYLDSGDAGPSSDGMADTIALREALVTDGWALGDDLMYVLGMGHAHNEAAWAARAPQALAFLFDDPRRVAP